MKAITLLASLSLFTAPVLFAQAPGGGDAKLREQVKSLNTRLQAAEAERTTLQADKAALEERVKRVEKSFEDLTKQMATEKETATKERERLASELAAKDAELTKTVNELKETDTRGKQSSELAAKLGAERNKLQADNIKLKTTVDNQRTHNRKMHEIAMEVLERYSKFGLGTAMLAREPFVGITRARLETMVEEYGAQINAERIKIDGTSPKPVSATPAATGRPADGQPGRKEKPQEKKSAASKP